jgi:hypothetical protein
MLICPVFYENKEISDKEEIMIYKFTFYFFLFTLLLPLLDMELIIMVPLSLITLFLNDYLKVKKLKKTS